MRKASAGTLALVDRKLLTKSRVLDDETASVAESRAKGAEETEEDGSHHLMMLQVGR
jgi:hypothetical protein